jgi:hypothetical protein
MVPCLAGHLSCIGAENCASGNPATLSTYRPLTALPGDNSGSDSGDDDGDSGDDGERLGD